MLKTHMTNEFFLNKELVYQNNTFDLKPVGLWYAFDNGWIEWCEDNQPEWIKPNLFSLEINYDEILILSNENEVNIFNNKYGLNNNSFIKYIDWNLVKKDFKGIEITFYDYNFRMLSLSSTWYYCWDIASGCIWDLSAIEKISILPQPIT